jgi:hypothetical protein
LRERRAVQKRLIERLERPGLKVTVEQDQEAV